MNAPLTRGLAALALVLLGCGGGSVDSRYPVRPAGCPVKSLPGSPTLPVDDLGAVRVECRAGGASCERQLLDAVCARGGDVAWGTADNALTATTLVAHAAQATLNSRRRKLHLLCETLGGLSRILLHQVQ